MFTKKLEDQFSADLLNTVRSVLGEAKHDKECECEKCEKEEEDDEDEDETKKEGYVPTADEPTEANKKTAQKIRDMMAKEKKPAKKEVKEGKRGLWDNIHAKRKRIKAGSGERMRKPGSEGAPTDADFKASQKEEVEQIAELSKPTLGSYIKKAAGSVGQEAITAGLKIKTGENPTKNLNKTLKRQKGIETATNKLTKEEQEFIDALNNDTLEEEKNLTGLPKSTAEKNKQYIEVTHLLGHKKKVPVHPTNAYKALNRYRNDPSTKSARIVSEDVELEEGRGRPPKEGSAAWHAKMKQDNDDMPALGVQLRKAKSMNKKVRFMNGKEHEIHPNHINRFEDHMAARKTSQDKAAFQKQAHKSHEDFVKAVSAPVPKASKDTGEIVKYRH
jgi:hypothetical protein